MRKAKQARTVLERRELVSRMLSLEFSPDEIAAKLGILRKTVYNDMLWIREFARKKILLNRKEVMDLAFTRLEMVSREAVLAWRRSQEDAVEITEETVPDEETGLAVVVKRTEKRKGQVGSPAFLDTVKDATWKTATLFGAVVKDVTPVGLGAEVIPDKQIFVGIIDSFEQADAVRGKSYARIEDSAGHVDVAQAGAVLPV